MRRKKNVQRSRRKGLTKTKTKKKRRKFHFSARRPERETVTKCRRAIEFFRVCYTIFIRRIDHIIACASDVWIAFESFTAHKCTNTRILRNWQACRTPTVTDNEWRTTDFVTASIRVWLLWSVQSVNNITYYTRVYISQ